MRRGSFSLRAFAYTAMGEVLQLFADRSPALKKLSGVIAALSEASAVEQSRSAVDIWLTCWASEFDVSRRSSTRRSSRIEKKTQRWTGCQGEGPHQKTQGSLRVGLAAPTMETRTNLKSPAKYFRTKCFYPPLINSCGFGRLACNTLIWPLII